MKFKLDTEIPEFDSKISYDKKLVFLGSCFSDDISAYFKNAGFNVLSNPFGTIFHPHPLAQILENCIENNSDFKCFEAKNKTYSWNTSTLFSGNSESDLRQKLQQIQTELKTHLETSSHLFITLGTAWGYELKPLDFIVANCHKQNNSLFEKKLTDIARMKIVWGGLIEKLKIHFPNLKIIFTVSPVRHIKDGLIENNRSKSRLFELISQLEQEHTISYFPSYEIVMDELRDYRFFKADFIHPNEQAIHYIWEKIRETYFDKANLKLVEEVEKLRKLDQHQVLSDNAEERKNFEEQKNQKIKQFLSANPKITW